MPCVVCGRTEQECKIRTIKGMQLCPKHVTQHYRNGRFLSETIYDGNQIIYHDDFAEIILKDKYCNVVGSAIIDIEDVDRCSQLKWHIKTSRHTNYAIATIDEHTKVFLHRFVLNYDGPDDIDHKDRDGLNNRKSNLEVCSHSKNLTNQGTHRKGIKRVPSGRYQAHITHDYQDIYLGTFDTEDEAYEARMRAEREIFQ